MNKTFLPSSFFKNLVFPFGAFSLAILLWLFVISGNQYSMMLDLPIEARNLNSQKTYLEEVPEYASVILKGKGRDLFKSYLLQNYSGFKLVLDLDGISQEYEFNLNQYFEKNPSKIVLPPSYNISFVEVVYPNRVKISLDEIVKKKVPIISNIYTTIIDGYIQIGKIKFDPDSVVVTGPKVELDSILYAATAKDTISNVSKYLRGEVDLLKPSRLIKYSASKVNYLLDIQQISERIIVDIPVEVINKVNEIRVFPSPQTVSLTVVGGVNKISQIESSDISIVVDFLEWKLSKNFYKPKVSIPFEILNWKDLSPRTIELGVAREPK